MRPSLSAVFLALNDGNEPFYNERLSNSGVFPTRGSRLLPPHAHLASATSTSSTSQPRSATLSYPPGHQTIAAAPSCSSFSGPWDRWCLKRFSAAKSQWCVKLNHGQRKYDPLQWILRRYNHLQTPRTIYSLEPPFHLLSRAPNACLCAI